MTKKALKKKCLPHREFLEMYSSSIKDDVVCDENGTQQMCSLLHCDLFPFILNIPDDVFSCNGQRPDVICVPPTIESASENAFRGCDFNFVYQTKEDENRILSKQKLDLKYVKSFAKIDDLRKGISGLTNESLMKIINLNEFITFAKKMESTKTVVPFEFFCKLRNENMAQHFMTNMYFKFFNKELAPYLKQLITFPTQEQTSFFAFANALGCFSKEFLIDRENERTESLLCHKASNLLARLLQSGTLKLGDFDSLFHGLSTDFVPNQDFFTFLSAQNGKNNFVNAKILVNNSEYNKDYFCKIMQNFDKAKGYKVTLDAHGKPVELPWETALNIFYHSRGYKGVTKENSVMAKIYGSRGIKQKTFSEACDIFEEAKSREIPSHILGKPLKEINNGSRMFTYEFLNKHDPKNAILGLYCSCCATLGSDYYGRDITIAGILAPDVQNVVIRDKKGSIIAKGTLFVNEKKGYAVFNDFEIEYKYRSDCEFVWHNDDEDNRPTINEIKRREILSTFMRAIKAFKVEYDNQHPEKPLKKVTVGMGFNKLRDICAEYFEKSNTLLKVPKDYSFRDAENHQCLLLGKNINRKPKQVVCSEENALEL